MNRKGPLQILQRYPSLQAVYHHLGRSTLYTDYQGSFSRALKVAQDECDRLRWTGGTYLAAALLGCGIVRLLQGETCDAVTALRRAIALGVTDPPLLMLAHVYMRQAVWLQYEFLPDHGPGVHLMDVMGRYNFSEEGQRWLSHTSYLSVSHGDESVSLEALVMDAHHMLRCFISRRIAGNPGSWNLERKYLEGWRQYYEELARRGTNPAVLAHLQILLAKLLTRNGERNQARQCERAAERLGAEFQDALVVANLNLARGDQLVAPLSSPEVWNCVLEHGTADSSANLHTATVETATVASDWARARQYYRAALGFFCSEGKPRGVAAIHLRWAYLHILEGRGRTDFERYWRDASHEVDTAAHLFNEAGDALAVHLCRAQSVLCAVGEGLVPEQRTVAAAIGQWGQRSGSFSYALGLGLFIDRVGWRWLTETGDYERALACFRLEESLFQALGAPLAEIQSITGQAKVYESVGEFSSFLHMADVAMMRSITTMERYPQLASYASLLSSWISSTFLRVARVRQAPGLVERVRSYIETQRRYVAPQLPAEITESPEVQLEKIDRWLQAFVVADDIDGPPEGSAQQMPMFADALLEVQLADADLYQDLYKGLGFVRAGDRDNAHSIFEHIREEAKSRPRAKRLYFEAIAYASEGDNDAAREAYEAFAAQELTALDEQVDNRQRDHARCRVAMGALTFFCRIKCFIEAQNWLLFLDNWPDWWKTEGPEQWSVLRTVALVKLGIGDLDGALLAYEEAIRIFEMRRRHLSIDELKVTFAASSHMQAIFFECARTLVELQSQPTTTTLSARELQAKAFRITEQGKARGLLDLMGGGLVGRLTIPPTRDKDTLPLLRWRRLNALRVSQCALLEHTLLGSSPDQAEVERLRQFISQTEKDIVQTEHDLDPTGHSPRSVTAEVSSLMAVAGDMPGNTLLLQYTFDCKTLVAWLVTQRGMIQVHRANWEEHAALSRAACRFHHWCAKASLDAAAHQVLDASGWQLHRILLAPFVDAIRSFRRIIVIPHGALHLVPFHALPFGENGRPLGATHVVTYLPSASIGRYLDPRKAPLGPKTVLALGNPSDMRFQDAQGSWNPIDSLPGAEEEALRVSGAIRGSKALIGPAATRQSLLDNITHYSILHLATHCRIVRDVPLMSALSLAGGDELSILDLLEQQLNLDLVVLSACQTGLGVVATGEDLVGFSRAVLAAGARAVLVSLWRVDDRATCKLFVNFYEALGGGLEPAEALHRAQRSVQDFGLANRGTTRDIEPDKRPVGADYSHPAYWAPFILVSA